MSLYQNVRPTMLDDFVGNEGAVSALKNLLVRDEHSHALLFTGPSGCGKTTLARLMAGLLGCNLQINLIEKNAASERGIDMARELERFSQASPIGGGVRVVILDEAHALTKDAQNALLKVFEDIPPFAYYFLCSTEPKKLLNTIKTRCEPIEVSKLSEDALADVIDRACAKADIPELDDDVIEAILQQAEGSPRMALVLTEKAAGLDPEKAIAAIASTQATERAVKELCLKLINDPWKIVAAVYNRIAEKEPEAIRRAVLGYLKSCLLRSKNPAEAAKFAGMMEELIDPTYDSGEPYLLVMLFRASEARKAT